MASPDSSLIPFFSFVPGAIPSAPRVADAFNTKQLIFAEEAHLFPTPIRVRMTTKGRGWTDFLTPIISRAPVVCSQRVVDAVAAEKLKGLKFIPVTLEHEKKSTVLAPPCHYYWMIPTGKILPYSVETYRKSGNSFSYWFDADDFNEARLRAGNEEFAYWNIPIYEKWDGSDVIRYTKDKFAASGLMHCSRRFVEVAYREKWSNLRVNPFARLSGHLKDLQNLPWPPELWYPRPPPRN